MTKQTAAEEAIPGDDVMTPDEVAEACKVKRNTVYGWIRDKKLAGVWFGGVVRIERKAFEDFKAQGRTTPQTDA